MEASTPTHDPLEQFLRDYVEVRDGLWEEIEPQVYDLMLPELGAAAGVAAGDLVRVALDPEALPEHRGCRFLGRGSPMLDDIFEGAQRRTRRAQAWYAGLSHRLADPTVPLRRLDLQPNARLAVQRTQAQGFVVLVHWFRATYASDQKEQETFVVALDGNRGRQVRHLDRLLDWTRLQEAPVDELPEAPRMPSHDIYRLARDRVVRTLAAAANTRRRELDARYARHEARMVDYYATLRSEIDEQVARAQRRSEDPARALARRAAVDREQQRRLAELRRKCSLRVRLALGNLLEIRQPKQIIEATLSLREEPRGNRPSSGARSVAPQAAALELIWDALTDSVEAPECPMCRHPTFALRVQPGREGWSCAECQRSAGR